MLTIRRKNNSRFLLPLWVFVRVPETVSAIPAELHKDHLVGLMRTQEVAVDLPEGRFVISVRLMFKLAKWTFSIGGEREIQTSAEKPTTLVISDRERLWNILFNIDLVIWAASFFFTLPTPWNVVYHVLSDGFFALWILRIIIIRKRYFILTPQND